MNPKIKDYLGWAALAALAVFVIGTLQFTSAYGRSVQPASTFVATGEGEAVVVPDIAMFSFGVTTEGGKDVASLQADNTAKANEAIAYIKSQGVEEKDIKTSSYNISPRYQYFSCPASTTATPCPPSQIVGYTVSQTVSVKVRDFKKIGDLLSEVTAKGANNVSGIQFTLDDEDQAENEARAEALANAKQKASDLAKAGGFRLGRIISIQESGSVPSPIYYAKTMDEARMGSGAAPAIEPGSEEIKKTVTVTYEIR